LNGGPSRIGESREEKVTQQTVPFKEDKHTLATKTMTSRVVILYGSQTGCAKDVAERIARESIRYHFAPDLAPMDDFDRRVLPTERIVVFVASTTGQAEAPHNMQKFWRFLRRKDIPQGSLKQLNFTVFGLGDSSYPVYNAVARRLYQRLIELGANPFHPRGLGDDQDELGYDEKLNPWLEGLWKALSSLTGSTKEALKGGRLLPPIYRARILSTFYPDHAAKQATTSVTPAATSTATTTTATTATTTTAVKDKVSLGSGYTASKTTTEYPICRPVPQSHLKAFSVSKKMYIGEIIRNIRLTSEDHSQDVRHIAFHLQGTLSEKALFFPGDVLDVYPQNRRDDVLAALDQLGLHPLDMIELKINDQAPTYLRANAVVVAVMLLAPLLLMS